MYYFPLQAFQITTLIREYSEAAKEMK